jgi:hypothetical protein
MSWSDHTCNVYKEFIYYKLVSLIFDNCALIFFKPKYLMSLKTVLSLVLAACTWNSSYLGGWDWVGHGSRTVLTKKPKKLLRPISTEKSLVWWGVPVIPARVESINRMIAVQGDPRQKVRPYLQNNQSKKVRRYGWSGRTPASEAWCWKFKTPVLSPWKQTNKQNSKLQTNTFQPNQTTTKA